MALRTPSRPVRGRRFTYGELHIDEQSGVLSCAYELDGRHFVEIVRVGADRRWPPEAREAARMVHLLAGVSYYKAGAPLLIDLGPTTVGPGERSFLRRFYIEGLGEFSARNELPLDDIEIVGGVESTRNHDDGSGKHDALRPLVPFGGGIDSIVTVDAIQRAHPDTALFVMSPPGNRFAAIERAAAVTGLPVLRAEREVDPAIRRPVDPTAQFNGHVPITGVLSAVAVLVAVLEGRGAVVLSNEWSASKGNIVFNGRRVNHQWSKSEEFELEFRRVLAGALGHRVDYFSFLRPFSELWVARRFALLEQFHGVFHSCNGAFNLDPAKRLDRWCGQCDKCCFIDLILAPFVDRSGLAKVFGDKEPLEDETLLPKFRDLLDIGHGPKPWECVGDTDECRTAAMMTFHRADRTGNTVLSQLVAELGRGADLARADAERLLRPMGSHSIPDALLAAATLV